jgi:hypothetical protein
VIANAPKPGVLHLVSAPSLTRNDRCAIGRLTPAYLCAQAIKQKLTPSGHIVLIGDHHAQIQADAIGLHYHERLTPPLGHTDLLARVIRKRAAAFERVICWNDELSGLLKGLPCQSDLISTRPQLAKRRVSGKVNVRVFERADRDQWESRNHQAEIDTVLHRLIKDPALPQCDHTRESLGIDTNSICVGMLADRSCDIDARSVGFLMGLLNVSGFHLTSVVPQGASHLTAARRHHHGLGTHFRLMIAQQPIITLLPIFDVLIHPCHDGSGSSELIERLCENADTPVLRLHHSGRDGLSRAPGVAGPIIEALDDIIANKLPDPIRRQAHAHV